MKKLILIIFITLLLAGCSTLTHVPKEVSFFTIDFRPYTQKGFLITPEKYAGSYESVGLVNFTIMPEANLVTTKSANNDSERTFWMTEFVYIEQVLDSVYSNSVSMGADAIMNFTLKTEFKSYVADPPLTIIGYSVSGFAIKRK